MTSGGRRDWYVPGSTGFVLIKSGSKEKEKRERRLTNRKTSTTASLDIVPVISSF